MRQGSISEINPLVDENGMVRIKARVNGSNKLFDGMNVRVSVKRSVGEQLVIPKTGGCITFRQTGGIYTERG